IRLERPPVHGDLAVVPGLGHGPAGDLEADRLDPRHDRPVLELEPDLRLAHDRLEVDVEALDAVESYLASLAGVQVGARYYDAVVGLHESVSASRRANLHPRAARASYTSSARGT